MGNTSSINPAQHAHNSYSSFLKDLTEKIYSRFSSIYC